MNEGPDATDQLSIIIRQPMLRLGGRAGVTKAGKEELLGSESGVRRSTQPLLHLGARLIIRVLANTPPPALTCRPSDVADAEETVIEPILLEE